MEQLRNIVTLGDTTATVTYNMTAYDVIEQETRYYVKYNMHTGTIVSTYRLDPVSMISTVSTMSLENEYVASNSTLNGVVRLNYSDPNKSRTGFVVGKHKILTSVSCADVYTPGSLPVSYTIFNSDGTEAGTYDIDYVHMEADYDPDMQSYDYSLLEVSENLSSRVMNLGVSRGNIVTVHHQMYIAGYDSSSDIDISSGYLDGNKIGFNYLYHNINNHNISGKIGGPLYVLDDQNRPVVIGLNKVNNNTAIRITTNMLHFVHNNPYIS